MLERKKMTPDEADLEIITKLPNLFSKLDPSLVLLVCLSRTSKDRKNFYKAVEAVSEYQTFVAINKYLILEFDELKKQDTIKILKTKGYIITNKQINNLLKKNK